MTVFDIMLCSRSCRCWRWPDYCHTSCLVDRLVSYLLLSSSPLLLRFNIRSFVAFAWLLSRGLRFAGGTCCKRSQRNEQESVESAQLVL